MSNPTTLCSNNTLFSVMSAVSSDCPADTSMAMRNCMHTYMKDAADTDVPVNPGADSPGSHGLLSGGSPHATAVSYMPTGTGGIQGNLHVYLSFLDSENVCVSERIHKVFNCLSTIQNDCIKDGDPSRQGEMVDPADWRNTIDKFCQDSKIVSAGCSEVGDAAGRCIQQANKANIEAKETRQKCKIVDDLKTCMINAYASRCSADAKKMVNRMFKNFSFPMCDNASKKQKAEVPLGGRRTAHTAKQRPSTVSTTTSRLHNARRKPLLGKESEIARSQQSDDRSLATRAPLAGWLWAMATLAAFVQYFTL